MAADNPERFPLGRLILDYLRTFLWPMVVLVVILVYRDDVRTILNTREVKVAGVFELGQQVAQIEEQTSEELADIGSLLEALRSRSGAEAEAVVSDIESKLSKVERNLNQQVGRIQSASQQQVQAPVRSPPEPPMSATAAGQSAAELERQGFQALLDKDLPAAAEAFAAAFKRWPDYHNVDEINKLLRGHARGAAQLDETTWSKLYRTILTDLSWGMPKGLRPEFRKRAMASY